MSEEAAAEFRDLGGDFGLGAWEVESRWKSWLWRFIRIFRKMKEFQFCRWGKIQVLVCDLRFVRELTRWLPLREQYQ